MRILVVTQYFWPENFRINDLCLGLQEKGHTITILTGKPNYPSGNFFNGYTFLGKSTEYWNNIKIYRAPILPRGKGKGFRLFLNYFSFAFFASFKAFFIKEKFDKILVYEPSPITVGFPAIVSKWRTGAPIYFWVQDLWPESISAAGGISNKFILKAFDHITRYIYRKSKKVLVQSKAFIPYILKQNVQGDKLIYYPNSTESFYNIVSKQTKYERLMPKGFNIMFAGNIGESQSFDTLLKTSLKLKETGLQVNWIILGDGRMKEYVSRKVKDYDLQSCFFLLGSYPVTEMPFFFACADVLLVSLKRSPIFNLTIPSKIQSYLACGKPILGSLDGEGARIIEESGAGLTAPAEDHEKLYDCVLKIVKMSLEKRQEMSIKGRNYYEREFERGFLINRLIQILLN